MGIIKKILGILLTAAAIATICIYLIKPSLEQTTSYSKDVIITITTFSGIALIFLIGPIIYGILLRPICFISMIFYTAFTGSTNYPFCNS